MKILGLKNIKKTVMYTQLVNFKEEDEFICKVARTPNEIHELIESGIKYVDNLENLRFFRKRK